jgi:putative redox protein
LQEEILSRGNATTVQGVMIARHEGGLKISAEIRGHNVDTDQPMGAGGADSAPTPLELIGAALGTCIALAVVQFCAARRIPTDGLHVVVEQQTAKAPYRVARYDVRLLLPLAFPDVYREAIERVARSCAAYNTLSNAPEISVAVEPA